MKEVVKCFGDFTLEDMHFIKNTIQRQLLKLGIGAYVDLDAHKIYNGKELICFTTSSFNSTPVIYENIRVKGEGFLVSSEHPVNGCYETYLNFSVNYEFDYFSGAHNGVSIGETSFVFSEGE